MRDRDYRRYTKFKLLVNGITSTFVFDRIVSREETIDDYSIVDGTLHGTGKIECRYLYPLCRRKEHKR